MRTDALDPDPSRQIQGQQRRCHELAAMTGARIIEVFADPATSGTALERSGLTRLLTYLDRERVDVVIAAEPGRLAGDQRLLEELTWQIEMTGATLLTDEPGLEDLAT